MMVRIDRQAAVIASANRSRLLQLLLLAVVAVLAQRLQVVCIEEQLFIATVRDDVVNDIRRRDSFPPSATGTARFLLQLIPAQPMPSLRVVQVLVSGRSHKKSRQTFTWRLHIPAIKGRRMQAIPSTRRTAPHITFDLTERAAKRS